MIDITENILSAPNDEERLNDMLSWLDECVGPKQRDELVHETGTMVYVGRGWELGCMRPLLPKKHNTMTFYVKFDDELEELMFKLKWPDSTSQIILK
jgi:hypothetical protein